jgi:hypothetical protein
MEDGHIKGLAVLPQGTQLLNFTIHTVKEKVC